MISVSNAFRTKLNNNERNYDVSAVITLKNGTVLRPTNVQLASNGFSVEDALCQDSSFSALGAAAINQATIVLSNIDEQYNTYVFEDATVSLSLSMYIETEDRTETISKGDYTVDEALYQNFTVRLNLLDNMSKFDFPYDTNLTYPATLDTIVRDACTKCGVQLQSYEFPYRTTQVASKPSGEDVTYREVISWCATLAGCYARINNTGKLEFKWFTNNPNTISSLFSQEFALDDTVITGVRAKVKVKDTDSQESIKEYISGTTGYVIDIEDTVEFITPSNAQTIVNRLGTQLIGVRFRKANITHLNDPTLEAGDIITVIDRHGREYTVFVTRTVFNALGTQTTVGASETPSRNSATRFSESTKSFVEARKLLRQEKSEREQALDELAEQLAEHTGLYSTIEPTQSGSIYYLHDMPTLEDSTIVWKMTTDAWGVSTDGGQTWNAGMTVDGDTIVRILTATGINASWINAGQLVVKDANNNETLFVDTTTGVVRIKATTFTLGGATIPEIVDDAVSDVEIGGRNLLSDTQAFGTKNTTGWYIYGTTNTTLTSNTYSGCTIRTYPSTTLSSGTKDIVIYQIPATLAPQKINLGKTYTLSFWAKGTGKFRTYFYGGSGYVQVDHWVASDGTTGTNGDGAKVWTVTSEWQRFWITYTLKSTGNINLFRNVLFRHDYNAGATLQLDLAGCKLEEGNKATNWTPAPEDAIDYIDSREIGGTNLLSYTGNYKDWYLASRWSKSGNVLTFAAGELVWQDADSPAIPWSEVNGNTFTLSFDYRADDYASSSGTYIIGFAAEKKTVGPEATSFSTRTREKVCAALYKEDMSTEWKRAVFVLENITDDWFSYTWGDGGGDWFAFCIWSRGTCKAQIRNIKFERGNVATAWSPNPNDIDISSRNLLRATAKPIAWSSVVGVSTPQLYGNRIWSLSNTHGTLTKSDEGVLFTHANNANANWIYIPLAYENAIEDNSHYILTFKYKSSVAINVGACYIIKRSTPNTLFGSLAFSATTEWTDFKFEFDSPSDATARTNWALALPYLNVANATFEIKDGTMMLTKGDKQGPWMSAPEDNEKESGGRNLIGGSQYPYLTTTAYTFNGFTLASGGTGTASVVDIADSPIPECSQVLRISNNTGNTNKDFSQKISDLQEQFEAGNLGSTLWVFSGYVRAISGTVSALVRVYGSTANVTRVIPNIGTSWQYIEVPLVFMNLTCTNNYLRINFGITGPGSIEYIGVKLERGNYATPWSAAPEDYEVGGTNLLRATPKSHNAAAYNAYQLNMTENLKAGQTYTLQYWNMVVDANNTWVGTYWGGGTVRVAPPSGSALTEKNSKPDAKGYYKYTFTVSDAQASGSGSANSWLNVYNGVNGHTGSNMTIGKWKLEKGNVPTVWSPAPEDIDDGIVDAKETAQMAMLYGTSSTAADTAEKVVVCPECKSLVTGLKITVTFTNANTLYTSALSLNVNGLGAKNIATTDGALHTSNNLIWAAGAIIPFIYDGTNWVVNMPPSSISGSSTTAGSTSTKVVAAPKCVIMKGATLSCSFQYANSASTVNLNVGSSGAHVVTYTGASSILGKAPFSWKAGATINFMFTGSAWRMMEINVEDFLGYYDEYLDATTTFNKLTNNGAQEGIYYSNGTLYINMTYLQGGICKLGGVNDKNGVLEIYNNSGTRVGRWDKDGLYIGNVSTALTSPNTKIDTSGAITTKSLTASKKITLYTPNDLRVELDDTATTSYVHGGMDVGQYVGGTTNYPYATYWNNELQIKNSALDHVRMSADRVYMSVASGTSSTRTFFDFNATSNYFQFGLASLAPTTTVYGTFKVSGTKNRIVTTKNYGDRLLYCYETPSPMFGDVGEGVVADDGLCYIRLDPTFAETIQTSQYQVFLQPYGDGRVWVEERHEDYFVVGGLSGLKFGWEVKAKQFDYIDRRLDKEFGEISKSDFNYANNAIAHIQQISRQRTEVI